LTESYESYDKKQSDNDAYMSELNDDEENDSVVEGIFRKEKDLQLELPRERVMLKVWWMHLRKHHPEIMV